MDEDEGGINYAAFSGMSGVASIQGLLATKRVARVLRRKLDNSQAMGRYTKTHDVQPTKDEYEQKHRTIENTYQMEPKVRFAQNFGTMKQFMQTLLQENIDKVKTKQTAREKKDLTAQISDRIKRRALGLGTERYKYVVMVTTGDKNRHDFRMGSRCIWQPSTDTSISVSIENCTHFIVAVLFALYRE